MRLAPALALLVAGCGGDGFTAASGDGEATIADAGASPVDLPPPSTTDAPTSAPPSEDAGDRVGDPGDAARDVDEHQGDDAGAEPIDARPPVRPALRDCTRTPENDHTCAFGRPENAWECPEVPEGCELASFGPAVCCVDP